MRLRLYLCPYAKPPSPKRKPKRPTRLPPQSFFIIGNQGLSTEGGLGICGQVRISIIELGLYDIGDFLAYKRL